MDTSSDLRAQLLNLGISLSQARAAIAAGNTTVEAALDWICANSSSVPSGGNGSSMLRLRNEQDDTFDADLHQALLESTRSQPVPDTHATSPIEESSEDLPSKKIKIVRQQPPTTANKVTPLLPAISRHNEEEEQAKDMARKTEANRRAEQAKRDKREAERARQRALIDLKEDREKMKMRHQTANPTAAAHSTLAEAEASGNTSAISALSQNSRSTAPAPKSSTMVQLRLKNGSVIKRSFENTATIRDLFEFARSMDGNIGSADISLIQPFPRREFTRADGDLTLLDASLCPSCSLNVLVQTPIPAPQPITPGAWLPPDVEMEEAPAQEPLDDDEEDEDEDDDQNYEENETGGTEMDEDNVMNNDNEDEDEDEDEGEDDDDDMMHAMPFPFPGQAPNHPVFGPGRGRGRGGGGFRGRGRGRGAGFAFSGTGHSLSGPSSSTDQGAETPSAPATEETDDARRQRILMALGNRAQPPEEAQPAQNEGPGKHGKNAKERVIPSLQALCTYEVAVMLTANDAKSRKNLRLLGENVGSQIAEGILQELVKLNKLDQLTFRGLHRCPISSIVLDSYSRATDSLMDAIGSSQARSLTYLSLKGCNGLTDKGFSNIRRFEELEFLDLSLCRITDRTLQFTLNLPYLNTLHLSQTKITTGGLARIIAESAWKSTLQALDVSECQGIKGPAVLVNLQELLNLSTLKLNKTLAFDQSPVQVPDHRAFKRLLTLDLATTPISDNDLIRLLPTLKSVEALNLTACSRITTTALECCVRELDSLQNINFPNREHGLETVLPVAAALPLTHLDLRNFSFVTDDAILALAAATNLQVLYLAGTKLTDIGSAVFVHLSCLKDLELDRTSIGDKSMQYLRDLGRIENLSLHRCQRLTTVGIAALSRCAFFTIKLKRLNLSYNKFIHDEALAAFAQCTELNTLNLDHTDVSEAKAFLLQNSLPNLKHLRVQGVTEGAVYEENPRPVFT